MVLKTLSWAAAAFICCGGASGSDAPVAEGPLHGCIFGTTPTCSDNSAVVPTTINPLPSFTFTGSTEPQTGGLLVHILVPDNLDLGSAFAINGASAINMGHWTAADKKGLPDFLGLTTREGSPPNPIDAWLAYTQGAHCGPSQNQACDPGASGYDVYQVRLGSNTLQGASTPAVPVLNLTGSSLPAGSLLVGFLESGDNGAYITTGQSGAIFEAGGRSSVPEPNFTWLLGAGLLIALMLRAARNKKLRNSVEL